MSRLVRAGLPEDRIVLDPGIGFGKTLEHNLTLLAHPEDWLDLGRPVLMALSMKSVFGGLLGLPPYQRGLATATATAMLRSKGIFLAQGTRCGGRTAGHDRGACTRGLLIYNRPDLRACQHGAIYDNSPFPRNIASHADGKLTADMGFN